jgi:hypothetical protein
MRSWFVELSVQHSMRALGRTALALTTGCGFVGFEGRTIPADAGPDDLPQLEMDAASANDSGEEGGPQDDGGALHDADTAPPLDATTPIDTGVAPDDAAQDAWVDPDPPATQVNDYCVSIPHLQRKPVIDGVVDGKLRVVPLTPQGWASKANAPLPDEDTSSYAFAWRDDGLYVFIRVVDATRLPPLDSSYIWEGDGVEIYFDTDGLFAGAPTYDNPGAIQILITAPADENTPSTKSMRFRNAVEQGVWDSGHFAAFPTADGYVFVGFLDGDTVDVAGMAL